MSIFDSDEIKDMTSKYKESPQRFAAGLAHRKQMGPSHALFLYVILNTYCQYLKREIERTRVALANLPDYVDGIPLETFKTVEQDNENVNEAARIILNTIDAFPLESRGQDLSSSQSFSTVQIMPQVGNLQSFTVLDSNLSLQQAMYMCKAHFLENRGGMFGVSCGEWLLYRTDRDSSVQTLQALLDDPDDQDQSATP